MRPDFLVLCKHSGTEAATGPLNPEDAHLLLTTDSHTYFPLKDRRFRLTAWQFPGNQKNHPCKSVTNGGNESLLNSSLFMAAEFSCKGEMGLKGTGSDTHRQYEPLFPEITKYEFLEKTR